MKLPGEFGYIDFSDWLRGLIAAFISGGANAVGAAFVAPALSPDLAMGTRKFYIMVLSMFAMSGTLNLFSFLRSRPLPDMKTVERTTRTTDVQGKPTVTVETVKETSVVAAETVSNPLQGPGRGNE